MYELYGQKTHGDRIIFTVKPFAKASTIYEARIRARDAIIDNEYESVTVWGPKSKVPMGVIVDSFYGVVWMTNNSTRLILSDGKLGRRY